MNEREKRKEEEDECNCERGAHFWEAFVVLYENLRDVEGLELKKSV